MDSEDSYFTRKAIYIRTQLAFDNYESVEILLTELTNILNEKLVFVPQNWRWLPRYVFNHPNMKTEDRLQILENFFQLNIKHSNVLRYYLDTDWIQCLFLYHDIIAIARLSQIGIKFSYITYSVLATNDHHVEFFKQIRPLLTITLDSLSSLLRIAVTASSWKIIEFLLADEVVQRCHISKGPGYHLYGVVRLFLQSGSSEERFIKFLPDFNRIGIPAKEIHIVLQLALEKKFYQVFKELSAIYVARYDRSSADINNPLSIRRHDEFLTKTCLSIIIKQRDPVFMSYFPKTKYKFTTKLLKIAKSGWFEGFKLLAQETPITPSEIGDTHQLRETFLLTRRDIVRRKKETLEFQKIGDFLTNWLPDHYKLYLLSGPITHVESNIGLIPNDIPITVPTTLESPIGITVELDEF